MTLTFADGTTHATDLVLGTDGIKSSVRRYVLGDRDSGSNVSFTNTIALRNLLTREKIIESGFENLAELLKGPSCWLGDSKVSDSRVRTCLMPSNANTVYGHLSYSAWPTGKHCTLAYINIIATCVELTHVNHRLMSY